MKFYAGYMFNSTTDWRIRKCTLRQPDNGRLPHRRLQQSRANTQSLTRTCRTTDESVARYDGVERECIRSSEPCLDQTVSALDRGFCKGCGSKDLLVHFPRSNASNVAVRVACPSEYHGSLRRACTEKGWAEIEGYCAIKTCPAHSIDLSDQPWAFLMNKQVAKSWTALPAFPAQWADPNFIDEQRVGAQVSFDALPKDSSATVACPRPPSSWLHRRPENLPRLSLHGQARTSYPVVGLSTKVRFYHTFVGNVTRRCLSNWQWGPLEGNCDIRQCPAGPQLLKLGTEIMPIHRKILLPAADPGTAIRVDCCQNFTKAGGCATRDALYGQIDVLCGLDGAWVTKPTAGVCHLMAELPLRIDGSRADKLYTHLREHVLGGPFYHHRVQRLPSCHLV
jgi:hypothetical protein